MIKKTSEDIILSLINDAVKESHGCYIEEVNFETLTIKVGGSEDVVSDCAKAVAEVLE